MINQGINTKLYNGEYSSKFFLLSCIEKTDSVDLGYSDPTGVSGYLYRHSCPLQAPVPVCCEFCVFPEFFQPATRVRVSSCL